MEKINDYFNAKMLLATTGLKRKHLSFITMLSWNQRVEEWSRVEVKESQKCNSCELEKDKFIVSIDDLPFLHLILLVLLWGAYVSVFTKYGTVFSFYTFYLTNQYKWTALIYLSFTKVFESSTGDFKWAWFHQLNLNITMTICRLSIVNFTRWEIQSWLK